LRREGDRGIKVTLVIAVEVHFEGATDMGLVVGMVIEGRPVNLDRAVIPARVGGGSRGG